MYRYAKKSLFKAVVNLVKGVNPTWIDKAVKYPKIDLHSWIENTPTDKEQSVREISFIVEAYSNTSYAEAVDMADQISQKLCNEPLTVEGYTVVSKKEDKMAKQAAKKEAAAQSSTSAKKPAHK